MNWIQNGGVGGGGGVWEGISILYELAPKKKEEYRTM